MKLGPFASRTVRRVTNAGVLTGIAVSLYLACVFGPAFADYCEMSKAVRTACEVARTDPHVEDIRAPILTAWMASNPREDVLYDDGSTATQSVPFSRVRNVDIDLNAESQQVTVSMHYTQHFTLPLLGMRHIDWRYQHTTRLDASARTGELLSDNP